MNFDPNWSPNTTLNLRNTSGVSQDFSNFNSSFNTPNFNFGPSSAPAPSFSNFNSSFNTPSSPSFQPNYSSPGNRATLSTGFNTPGGSIFGDTGFGAPDPWSFQRRGPEGARNLTESNAARVFLDEMSDVVVNPSQDLTKAETVMERLAPQAPGQITFDAGEKVFPSYGDPAGLPVAGVGNNAVSNLPGSGNTMLSSVTDSVVTGAADTISGFVGKVKENFADKAAAREIYAQTGEAVSREQVKAYRETGIIIPKDPDAPLVIATGAPPVVPGGGPAPQVVKKMGTLGKTLWGVGGTAAVGTGLYTGAGAVQNRSAEKEQFSIAADLNRAAVKNGLAQYSPEEAAALTGREKVAYDKLASIDKSIEGKKDAVVGSGTLTTTIQDSVTLLAAYAPTDANAVRADETGAETLNAVAKEDRANPAVIDFATKGRIAGKSVIELVPEESIAADGRVYIPAGEEKFVAAAIIADNFPDVAEATKVTLEDNLTSRLVHLNSYGTETNVKIRAAAETKKGAAYYNTEAEGFNTSLDDGYALFTDEAQRARFKASYELTKARNEKDLAALRDNPELTTDQSRMILDRIQARTEAELNRYTDAFSGATPKGADWNMATDPAFMNQIEQTRTSIDTLGETFKKKGDTMFSSKGSDYWTSREKALKNMLDTGIASIEATRRASTDPGADAAAAQQLVQLQAAVQSRMDMYQMEFDNKFDWKKDVAVWGTLSAAVAPFLALWLADRQRDEDWEREKEGAELQYQYWLRQYDVRRAGSGGGGGGGGGGGSGTSSGNTGTQLATAK